MAVVEQTVPDAIQVLSDSWKASYEKLGDELFKAKDENRILKLQLALAKVRPRSRSPRRIQRAQAEAKVHGLENGDGPIAKVMFKIYTDVADSLGYDENSDEDEHAWEERELEEAIEERKRLEVMWGNTTVKEYLVESAKLSERLYNHFNGIDT